MLSPDDVVSLVTEALTLSVGPRGGVTPGGRKELLAWLTPGAYTLAAQDCPASHHALMEFVQRLEIAVLRLRYFGISLEADHIKKMRNVVAPCPPFC